MWHLRGRQPGQHDAIGDFASELQHLRIHRSQIDGQSFGSRHTELKPTWPVKLSLIGHSLTSEYLPQNRDVFARARDRMVPGNAVKGVEVARAHSQTEACTARSNDGERGGLHGRERRRPQIERNNPGAHMNALTTSEQRAGQGTSFRTPGFTDPDAIKPSFLRLTDDVRAQVDR